MTPTHAAPGVLSRLAGRAAIVLAAGALLWLCFGLWWAGQPLAALGALAFGGSALAVYGTARSLAWKYLFPGVAGMLLFVAFPLAYTVRIGFTNYSSANLLEFDRARAYLLEQQRVDEERVHDMQLAAAPGGHRLLLRPRGAAADVPALATAVLDLRSPPSSALALAPLEGDAGTALDLRATIALRDGLRTLTLLAPDGTRLAYAGLREFAPVQPLWQLQADGALRHTETGALWRPNAASGYFENEAGERMAPGYRVDIGWAHYARMLLDADFRGPFVSIFAWTVAFAGLTVVFSAGLGLLLASLLNWEALPNRTLLRTLLFLPYAVPGFISILVFKGLFNQNFGEINAILDAVFGVRPAWFADPLLAKIMLLAVNTWLGFPYFMILCAGLIKAIPADLYEASAIAGASPWDNFRRITAPLILKPLTPLLIAAFAFNFNNFVLIALLTDGRPDFLDTKLPAGTTDILVSYTYRIAFTDAGQNFGLAAAISTLIFIVVALLALLQLRATRAAAPAR